MPKITALFYVKNHNINKKLLKTIIKAEELTQYNNNAIFNFAFNYGSSAEIMEIQGHGELGNGHAHRVGA